MGMHEAFVCSIAESLNDDTPRLIYADYSEEIGNLDVENIENPMAYWETDERGFGGHIANLLRSQQYVLGWDRIGDKHGRIHST